MVGCSVCDAVIVVLVPVIVFVSALSFVSLLHCAVLVLFGNAGAC